MSKTEPCHHCGGTDLERIAYNPIDRHKMTVTIQCVRCGERSEQHFKLVGTSVEGGETTEVPTYVLNLLDDMPLLNAMLWFMENVSDQPWRNHCYFYLRQRFVGK